MNIEEVFSSKPRMKILRLVAQIGALNISDIARRINLNYSTTNQHLKLLESEGILQQRIYGRIRMYRFNGCSPKAIAVQNLIEVWEEQKNEKSKSNQ